MSLTPSIGAVSASYWAYPALEMADSLNRIVGKGSVAADDIPQGVFSGIQRFFQLVREGMGEIKPQILFASLANYSIAARTVAQIPSPKPETMDELKAVLRTYSDLVKALETPHTLTPTELADARNVQKFLARLGEDGENESYSDVVRHQLR